MPRNQGIHGDENRHGERGYMQRLTKLFVLGAASIFAAVGCSQIPLRKSPAIVLGAVYNLTGTQESLDNPSLQGVRLAVVQTNEAGGVLDRPVQLEVVDGESSPALIAERTAALLHSQPSLAGLVGLSDTDMLVASVPSAAAAGRVFITSGATSPHLPDQFPRFLFLACFGDNVQAAAGAQWAYEELKARRAVVLFNDTMEYTRLLHGYFESQFASLGGTIVTSRAYRPGNLVEVLKDLPPADLLYLAGAPDGVPSVIPALRSAGVELPILGGDGLDIGAEWQNVKEAHDVYFTTHVYLGDDNPDPDIQSFRRAFVEQFPGQEPDAFSALGYDAMGLLLQAIRVAGSDRPESVLEALSGMEAYEGITGVIGYFDGNRIPRKSVTVTRVSNGRESFVARFVPREVPAP